MQIVAPEHRVPLPRLLYRWRRAIFILGLGLAYTVVVGLMGANAQKSGFFGEVVRPIIKANISLPSRVWAGMQVEPTRMIIDMKFDDLQKLQYKRQTALDQSVLFADAEDFVPATLTVNGQRSKVKIRLKGDTVAHLSGKKWSFRVKVKGKNTVMGMKQFSLHHPRTRNYVFEWLSHRLMKREGILGLNYEFVEVSLNGESLGVYALEEHFEKRLLERQERREGPIIRFSEDLFWRDTANVRWRFEGAEPAGSGSFESSPVDGFKVEAMRTSPKLWPQYVSAVQMLEGFRRGELSASEVFDVDRLARFFALSDVLGGFHGTVWHNSRFYYNPLTARLEPVAFDANAGRELVALSALGHYTESKDGHVITSSERYWRRLFEDDLFVARYVENLERFSQRSFLEQFITEVGPDLDKAMATLWREFPDYRFEPEVWFRNQDYARAVLTPYSALHAYLGQSADGVVQVQLTNLQGLPLQIETLSNGKGVVFRPVNPTVLRGKQPGSLVEKVSVPFAGEIQPEPTAKWTVTYRILGSSRTMTSDMAPYPLGVADGFGEDFMRRPPNPELFPFLVVDEVDKQIRIVPGTHTVDQDMILPPGYEVMAGPGTSIDLVKQALILSRSPVNFIGVEGSPVRFHTSDGTGMGLTVLAGGRPSEVRYTVFEGLNAPSRPGWTLTGAVTFYESPLKMSYSISTANRSEDAINFVRTKFEMDHMLVEKTTSDAFDADFCQGTISDSTFKACGNDCVDVSGSLIQLIDLTVDGSGDKAVSAGEASTVSAKRVVLRNVKLGLVAKDRSELTVEGADIQGAEYYVGAFQKKPEFGAGHVSVTYLKGENMGKLMLQPGSTASVNGEDMAPTMDDPAALLYPPGGKDGR
ncbi:MAG: CotH kinase family protein [Myxococcales bacterium]|nr:CotH kinase family protein [Myxococcales bacterium]